MRLTLPVLSLCLSVLACGGSSQSGPSDLAPDAGNPPPSGKRIFVSSARYQGDLATISGAGDGLSGADQLCTTLAHGAGLTGTFKAWLSSPDADAIDRIADVGPWYQVSAAGQWIKTFNNKANLAGTPLAGIQYTETGEEILAGECAWTGTASGGRKTSETCSGFTSSSASTFGALGEIDRTTEWTAASSCAGQRYDSCSATYRIYCLEQ